MAQTVTTQTQQQRQPQAAEQAVALQNNFVAELESYTPQLVAALPAHVTVDKFKRVMITAVSLNPDLLYANRRTLFTAAAKCAADGLVPDGREAALVVYRDTKVKQRDPQTGIDREIRIDMVQHMPMVAGIRKRMRNSGEVASAVAEAVFERDKFRYSLGDQPYIEHEPPALGEDRGNVIGAYAIIRLANGEVIRDVMDRKTIDAARAISRGKDTLMWKDFFWEAAKKTVLRRASKQAPASAELERLLNRDEEIFEEHRALPPPGEREPEPVRPIEVHGRIEPHNFGATEEYEIVDLDGAIASTSDGLRALNALREIMPGAARMGIARLDGWFESNQTTVDMLAREYPNEAGELARDYDELRTAALRLGSSPPATQAAPPPAEPQRGPVASETAPATTLPPPATAPSHAPPLATAAQDNQPRTLVEPTPVPQATLAQEEPGAYEPPEPPRPSLAIPPIERGHGVYNWDTWTRALFIPKLRRQLTTHELAWFIGDNTESLNAARLVLDAADRKVLEDAISEQWRVAQ